MKITTTKKHLIELEVFGRSKFFEVEGKKPSFKNEKALVKSFAKNWLSRITEVHKEWGRKDNKNILLFYTPSSNYGHMKFQFACEMDEALLELSKECQTNREKIKNHVLSKFEELNFNV